MGNTVALIFGLTCVLLGGAYAVALAVGITLDERRRRRG